MRTDAMLGRKFLAGLATAALAAACHGPDADERDTDSADTDTPAVDTDIPDTDEDTDTDVAAPRCGDGDRSAVELCDDGNTDDTDSCSNSCHPAPPPGADALEAVTADVSCEIEVPGAVDFVDPGWHDRTVTVSAIALQESGDADEPLSSAAVSFARVGSEGTRSEVSADDGTFDVELPACTTWTATVAHAGVWTSTTHNLAFSAPPDSLYLRAVLDTLLAGLAEQSGVTLDESAGIVGGHTVDCAGVPMADALVVVRGADGATILDASVIYMEGDSASAEGPTGASGSFVALNVPPGDAWVEAWAVHDDGVALRSRHPVHVAAHELAWVDLKWGQLDDTRDDPACALPPVHTP